MKEPLEGILVLDLTRHLSGPFATVILRDLGARVIKFEPAQGDPARNAGPFQDGDSAYFHPINRGKESVQVDLRDPADISRIRTLLSSADCLVENFRPGVMDKIGLGPEEILQKHPYLIYASLSGFGATGPYSSRPAYDVVIQAMGGVMSVTGEPGGTPTRVGVSQADLLAGIYTALAISAALYRRAASGEGGHVDVSMLEAQMCLGTHAFGLHAANGEDPGPIGNRHPTVAPFDTFPTRDGHVAIAVVDDAGFSRLCRVLEVEELAADRRFSTRERRLANVEELTRLLARRTASFEGGVLRERLVEASVACGPVNTIGALVADPHVAAREALLNIKEWGHSGLPVPRLPFTIDKHRLGVDSRAPELGSTTLTEIIAELDGRSQDAVGPDGDGPRSRPAPGSGRSNRRSDAGAPS